VHNEIRLSPVSKSERFEILDILRGFALYGVLMSNLVWFCYSNFDPEIGIIFSKTKLDEIVIDVETFLVVNKFITIFSFLFGIGFAIQLDRIIQRGEKFSSFYFRRMMWLFVIGFISIFLIGLDILHLYAILGVCLIFSRSLSNFQLLIWGIICTCVFPVLIRIFISSSHYFFGEQVDLEQLFSDKWEAIDKLNSVFYGNNYVDVIKRNFADAWVWFTTDEFITIGVSSFGLFLLGFLVGRSKLLINLKNGMSELDKLKFYKVLRWSLIVGVICQGVLLLDIPKLKNEDLVWVKGVRELLWRVGVLALALFYICLIIHIHQRGKALKLFHYFAVVGRMALTNFVGQSVIIFFIFYGLAFYGKVGATISVVLTTIIYIVQVIYSHWWLKRFRYGPLEWLWRTLSYGKLEKLSSPRGREK